MLRADVREHCAQIDGRAVPDIIEMSVQPLCRGVAPQIAQMGQKRPFRIHLRRGAKRDQRILVFDDVDALAPIAVFVQLAFVDQPINKINGAELFQ